MKSVKNLLPIIVAVLFSSLTLYSTPVNVREFCGVKFGQSIKSRRNFSVNNVGAHAYNDVVKKEFYGANEYIVFTTPITKKVFMIRAIRYASADEIESVFNSIVTSIEDEFGVKAETKAPDKKIIKYNCGVSIEIIKASGCVMIDAVDAGQKNKLMPENIKVQKKMCEEGVKVLSLFPQKRDDKGRLLDIGSVFRITFGKNFRTRNKFERDLGTHRFTPAKPFMECQRYEACTTARTKDVYMVVAEYTGDGYDVKANQIRHVIETATGRKMTEEKGGDITLRFGDCLILIKNRGISKAISVSFIKLSLLKRHEQEKAAK